MYICIYSWFLGRTMGLGLKVGMLFGGWIMRQIPIVDGFKVSR